MGTDTVAGDIVLRQDGQLPLAVKTCYKDMRDGTHALVRAVVLVGQDEQYRMHWVRTDSWVEGLVGVNLYQHDLHEGHRFKFSCYVRIPKKAARLWLFRTGLKEVRVRARIAATGNCVLYVFENPKISALGTLVDSLAKNRQTRGSSEARIYRAPKVISPNVKLLTWLVPGGCCEIERPWVLESKRDYLFVLLNVSKPGILTSFGLGWSEY